MDEINNPFKPSIKLLPLIKINKQNAEKKIAKNLLFKIISNNSILDEFILYQKLLQIIKSTNIELKIFF